MVKRVMLMSMWLISFHIKILLMDMMILKWLKIDINLVLWCPLGLLSWWASSWSATAVCTVPLALSQFSIDIKDWSRHLYHFDQRCCRRSGSKIKRRRYFSKHPLLCAQYQSRPEMIYTNIIVQRSLPRLLRSDVTQIAARAEGQFSRVGGQRATLTVTTLCMHCVQIHVRRAYISDYEWISQQNQIQ